MGETSLHTLSLNTLHFPPGGPGAPLLRARVFPARQYLVPSFLRSLTLFLPLSTPNVVQQRKELYTTSRERSRYHVRPP